MNHFVEVTCLAEIPKGHPHYVKPEVGDLHIVRSKMLVDWTSISPSCAEVMEFKPYGISATLINTHLGQRIVEMPFDEVSRALTKSIDEKDGLRKKEDNEKMSLIANATYNASRESFDSLKEHNYMVFETAQKALCGILSGPMANVMIVNAMQTGNRTTLGHILIQEAWDMAEALVDKYEAQVSLNQTKSEG